MRSRRALSTVVGAVFAIIALTSTVTYVSYSMGILDNYNQSVLTKNQQLSDINKEKFQISSVTVPNGKLNITVANTGSVPINFTKIWIQNQTAYSNGVDWTNSYVPTNNFVAPGGVLTKIGQNIPVYINSAKSYNVKLVTSRGNTQQFTVNSISSTKLNIQLYAFPSTVSSGFTTQIVMVVTNNSTGPIVNLTPTISVSPPQPPTLGNPTCTIGSMNPSKSDSLLPGGTAVFIWPLTATGSANQVCTITAQLPNGQTIQTSTTITQVTLSSTTYAQNAGVMTIDYTSFRWATSAAAQWNTGWDIAPCAASCVHAFQVTIQNNNQTAGSNFYISKNTLMVFWNTASAGGGTDFFIVNSTNLNTMNPTAYSSCNGMNDYCQKIPYQGTFTITFEAKTAGQTDSQKLSNGQYMGFLILYGKFSTSQTDTSGKYAQNLPYIAAWVG